MQITLTFRNNSWNVKRRLLHTRGSGMCYITRGSLRVDISNISDDGCLIFLNTDFADAHWKVMYCTLLARRKWNYEGWLCVFLNTDFADSADAHWKVMYRTLLATCGSADYCYSTLLNIRTLVCICAEPREQRAVHCVFNEDEPGGLLLLYPIEYTYSWFAFARSHTPSSNVRYIAFSMWAYDVVQNKGRAFWARPLLFM